MTKGVQDLMVEVERIRDVFQAALFTGTDATAALELATADCAVLNQPTGTGGSGTDGLRHYLEEDLLPHRPADLAFRRISRTGNRWTVAQEDTVTFTHDRELPWLLPGVAATGRHVEVLAISVVTIRRSLVTAHRTLWDHAALLRQLDLDLDAIPIATARIPTG